MTVEEYLEFERTSPTRHEFVDGVMSGESKKHDGRDDHIVDAACVLFEVLSESTESVDVTEKLSEYTRIPSLQRYVLVSQHQRFVTVFKRVETRWEVEILEDVGEVEIPCLETTLSLEQIYGLGVSTRG
jgi:Uma2 family endonuclease